MPFEPDKNADELGINKKAKFVEVAGGGAFSVGTVLELTYDDESSYPEFWSEKLKKSMCLKWSQLDYAPKSFSRDGLCVGDVVVTENGNRRRIIEVGETCFAYSCTPLGSSESEDFMGGWLSYAEVIRSGWTIEGAPQPIEEVTMEEVCEKFGHAVKIKKE